jgi:hypothetical protein
MAMQGGQLRRRLRGKGTASTSASVPDRSVNGRRPQSVAGTRADEPAASRLSANRLYQAPKRRSRASFRPRAVSIVVRQSRGLAAGLTGTGGIATVTTMGTLDTYVSEEERKSAPELRRERDYDRRLKASVQVLLSLGLSPDGVRGLIQAELTPKWERYLTELRRRGSTSEHWPPDDTATLERRLVELAKCVGNRRVVWFSLSSRGPVGVMRADQLGRLQRACRRWLGVARKSSSELRCFFLPGERLPPR